MPQSWQGRLSDGRSFADGRSESSARFLIEERRQQIRAQGLPRSLSRGAPGGRSPAQPAVDTLFDTLDRNHDGVISRAEFRGALQSHLTEGGQANPSLVGSQLVSGSRPSSRSGSARGVRTTGSAVPSAVAKDASSRPASTRSLKMAPRPGSLGGKDGVVNTLQAKQLQSELTVVTQAIQGQAADWAELSGQDMVSRAGAVTVRKMVETTKALLQGLEGALILRAGFIAGCFHMWRCETTLSRAGRLYQDEFQRHHEEWTLHLEATRQSFEEQLNAHAHHAMTHKEIMKQHAAFLIDKWAYGEEAALRRESFRAWHAYAAKEKKLKATAGSVHIVIDQWAGGKVKGIGRVALQSWRTITLKERSVRQKESDEEKLRQAHQAQLDAMQQEHDRKMQEALQDIERRHHDSRRNIDIVLAKWQKGTAKGAAIAAMQAWAQWSRKQAESDRRTSNVEMQLKRFLEGDSRGLKHMCYMRWKSEYQNSSQSRRHTEIDQEREHLEAMLVDQQRLNEDLQREKISAAEQRKLEADAVVKLLISKWELGSTKGLLKVTYQAWSHVASEAGRRARGRQALHSVLLKTLEGDKRAGITMAFRNWAALMRSEKQSHMAQEQEAKFQTLLSQTQAEHDQALGDLENKAQSLAARAHQACKSMIEQWLLGSRKGLVKTVFSSWLDLKQRAAKSERRRSAVTGTLMRMVEGERRGRLHFTWQGWTRFVKEEQVHAKHRASQATEMEKLNTKVERLLAHAEARMVKYAVIVAGKRGPLLKGMTFSAWRTAAKGEVAGLEKEREREVAFAEMERQKQMLKSKHKADAAKVLGALGFKRHHMLKTEAFEAWHYEWVKSVDAQAHKLSHSKAMLEYSQFIIKGKMKKDSKALLASTFAEWHREGRVLMHQLNHESAEQQLAEIRAYVAQLERQTADLQEQVGMYDRQVDLITGTLQKELKTKEELAGELRNAHAYMRKNNFTPTTADTAGVGADWSRHGDWSRTSSEKTIDQIVTTTPRTGKAAQPPPALTVPALPGMPAMPQLPKGSRDLLRGSAASAGDATPDVSPRRVDWDVAVSRMSEDGFIGKRTSRRPKAPVDADKLFSTLDTNHDGVISRAEWTSAVQSAASGSRS